MLVAAATPTASSVVLARGPREIPGVNQRVGAGHPPEDVREGDRAELRTQLRRGQGRIAQGVPDAVGGGPPGPVDVVAGGRRRERRSVQAGQRAAMIADHVRGHVPRGPAGTR
jgi:hypothetical protein